MNKYKIDKNIDFNENIIHPVDYIIEYKDNLPKEIQNTLDAILLNIKYIEKIQFYALKIFVNLTYVRIIFFWANYGNSKTYYNDFYLENNILYEFRDETEKNIFMRKKKIESIL